MHEMVRNYHKNEGHPSCAIKNNAMKAYDNIHWEIFFMVTMRVMEFPEALVGSFCVGDLSPFVFVLVPPGV